MVEVPAPVAVEVPAEAPRIIPPVAMPAVDVQTLVLLQMVRSARRRAWCWLLLGVAIAVVGGVSLTRAFEHGGVAWTGGVVVGVVIAFRAAGRLVQLRLPR